MILNEDTLNQLDGLESEPGKPLIFSLAQIFLDGTPKDLAELTGAAKSGNFSLVEKIAHALKSSTASMGLEDLASLLATLEKTAREKSATTADLALSLDQAYRQAAQALTDFVAKKK